jgi:hypothetical protein
MAKPSKRTRRAKRNFAIQLALIDEREARVLECILRATEDPRFMGLARTLRTLRESERLDQEEQDSQVEMFKKEQCRGYLPNRFQKRMI